MKQIACIMIMVIFLTLINAPAFGAGQEFQTLELVRTYQSEDEIREVYPELFPKTHKIQVEGEKIQFIDTNTGSITKQIQTQNFGFEFEPLTEDERQQLPKPVLKHAIARHLSDDNTLLLVTEGTVTIEYEGYIGEGSFHPQKNTLYNAYGDMVTELPVEISMLTVSPDKHYFVGYDGRIGGHSSLYFYSYTGNLIRKQEIEFDTPVVDYTPNGKFIQAYSNSAHQFAIFTNTGDIVYQGNRSKLSPPIKSPLHGVFTTDYGDLMLLTTDRHIHLYTTQEKFLWTYPFPGIEVSDCLFFGQYKKMGLKITTQRSGDDWYNIQIHSLETGAVIDTIIGVADFIKQHDHLIIIKGGQYYDYQIH